MTTRKTQPDVQDAIIDTLDTTIQSRSLTISNGSTRAKPIPLTPEQRKIKQDLFLACYAKCANNTQACRETGINLSSFHYWMDHYPSFVQAYEIADKMAQDMLIETAVERAVKGVRKPVVSLGKIARDDAGNILYETVYSDVLLLRLMSYKIPGFREARNPEMNVNIDINGARESLLERLKSSIRVVESESSGESGEGEGKEG